MDHDGAILAANAAYYRAFSTADFAAMNDLWADDDVSCVHPGWPVLIGRQAILQSYRDIFRNPQQERIEYRDETAIVSDDYARVLCIETVGETTLVATNLFKLIGGEWRLVHHQASPIAKWAEEADARSTLH